MRLLQGHVVAGLFIVGNIHSTSFDTLGFLFAMTVQFLALKNWTRWSNFFPGQLLRDRHILSKVLEFGKKRSRNRLRENVGIY